MFASQGGVCAICRQPEGREGRSLSVDHDHDSGVVRGLLCDSCNVGLGRFRDDPELVRSALEYLSSSLARN